MLLFHEHLFLFVVGVVSATEWSSLALKVGLNFPSLQDSYDVFVAAQGFAPVCKQVAIVFGRCVELKAKLRVDSEHMEDN